MLLVDLIDEYAQVVERFARDVGDLAIVGGVSHRDHHVGSFVLRSIEDLAEELHRRGGVGEGRESGVVRGGQEHSGRDPDGFVEVVDLSAVVGCAERHDDDEPGDGVDVGLVGVGLERFEVFEPAVGGAVFVELLLDLFDGDADLVLSLWIGDRDEAPGLFVGSRWRGSRGEEDLLDDFLRDGFVGKVTDGSAF